MPFKDLNKRREYQRKNVAKWRAANPERNEKNKKAYWERTEGQRKKWAKEYYKKNKAKIIKQTTEYRKNNPNVKEKSAFKSRDKNKNKSVLYRRNLKESYVVDLIQGKSGISKNEIRKQKQLIEVYKLSVTLKRLLNEKGK